MVADIQPPDTELRIAIFKSKAMAMNVDLSNEVLTFIAENTKSNVRQIEGVIKKLGAYSVVNGGERITVDTAKKLLSDMISDSVPPSVVAERIIKSVGEHYNVDPEDIKGKSRRKEIAITRHIAIYIINHVMHRTLESIGNIVGGRDHSTVLSSINVVSKQMKMDASFEHEINEIIKEFQ
jgi:chromosomal replication initiator protein